MIIIDRLDLKLHRSYGSRCNSCGHGSIAGLSWWQVRGSPTATGALLCYMCAAQALAAIAEAGVEFRLEQVAG